jgi:peptide/nickel transport system permease protein
MSESDDPEREQSAFETKSEYQQSPLEQLEEQFDKWIGGPVKILWSDYRGKVGLFIIALYLLIGTVGVLTIATPSKTGPFLQGPFESMRYPLGTDGLGQGLLSLMVHSTPNMLKMIIAGAIFGNILGVTMGLVAGYLGGTIDKVLMTFADTIASIPGLPLLVIIAAIIEPKNPFLVGIVVNITGWAGQARGIRSQVLPLIDEEYVEAARSIGSPDSRIMVREILPNLLPLIFIGFLGGAVGIISKSVGLYFLGLLPFTTTSNWGVILNYAYERGGALYTVEGAHWIIVPMFFIVGLSFGLTLLAQAFDQVFNPRVRARHESGRRGEEASTEPGATAGSSSEQMAMDQ